MTRQLTTLPTGTHPPTAAGERGGSAGQPATATPRTAARRKRVELTGRDLTLLRWIGEQYCVRGDLLAVLMAAHSTDPATRTAGRVSDPAVRRRVGAWRAAGLVATERFWANTPATVWLTADGMAAAGLAWRASSPTFATVAHRHAVGVVRAWVESRGRGYQWVSERELREG